MNRASRRANLSSFRRAAAHARSLTTYLLAADDPLLDWQVLLRDAVQYWRSHCATRKPICIGGRKTVFAGEVEPAAFLLATSSASSGTASVSGICVTCWHDLSEAELEKIASRVLQPLLPGGRFR